MRPEVSGGGRGKTEKAGIQRKPENDGRDWITLKEAVRRRMPEKDKGVWNTPLEAREGQGSQEKVGESLRRIEESGEGRKS